MNPLKEKREERSKEESKETNNNKRARARLLCLANRFERLTERRFFRNVEGGVDLDEI